MKVYRDDFDTLVNLAKNVETVVSIIPGAADVGSEQVTGLPMLSVIPDRERLTDCGLDVAAVQETLRFAIGGETVWQVFEGDRRFDLVVRLHEDLRADLESLKGLPITLPQDANRESERMRRWCSLAFRSYSPVAWQPQRVVETMPTEHCQYYYACRACRVLSKPLPGDCCAFCSYGSVPCPSVQRVRRVGKDNGHYT